MKNKKQIIFEYKQMYLRNEPIGEIDILENNEEFFKEILRGWGSWHKFVKEIGLLERHLKERSRYFIYLTMLVRADRFGEQVFLLKNIEPEMKKKIVENFGSAKHLLRDIIENWGPERILYDTHTFFITGGTPKLLPIKKPILYKYLIKFFETEEKFYKEYQKRFWIDPLTEIKDVEGKSEEEEILDFIVKLGYVSKKKMDEIKQVQKISDEEVLNFIKMLPKDTTEEELEEMNKYVSLAIKQRYGSLENARINLMLYLENAKTNLLKYPTLKSFDQ